MAAVSDPLLGTLVGQSTWAMRGLDPIFQVLRTVPPEEAFIPLSESECPLVKASN